MTAWCKFTRSNLRAMNMLFSSRSFTKWRNPRARTILRKSTLGRDSSVAIWTAWLTCSEKKLASGTVLCTDRCSMIEKVGILRMNR